MQQAYANQLDEVSDYCRSKNIKLIFLIIPNPMYPEDSQTADEFAVEYLNTLNIPVITVKDELMAIALEDRIVSPQDMHLSEESNRVVANLIWPAIMKLPKSQKITN